MAISSFSDTIVASMATVDPVLMNGGYTIADALSPILKNTLYLFVMGVLVISAIRYILSDESIMDGVQKLFMFALLVGAVNMAMTPSTYKYWTESVYGGFTSLASVASQAGNNHLPVSSSYQEAAVALNQVDAQIYSLATGISAKSDSVPWYDLSTRFTNGYLQLKLAIMSSLVELVGILQLLIFVYLSLIVAFYFGLAVAFGPIAIITYVFKPLSFLADGWLRFFIGAGLVKIVFTMAMAIYGVLLIQELKMAMPAFALSSSSNLTPDQCVAAVKSLGFWDIADILIIGVPAIMILWSAPEIADKIMSGSRVGGGMASTSVANTVTKFLKR
jgi:type IV secretory pathway VirB6-like protein